MDRNIQVNITRVFNSRSPYFRFYIINNRSETLLIEFNLLLIPPLKKKIFSPSSISQSCRNAICRMIFPLFFFNKDRFIVHAITRDIARNRIIEGMEGRTSFIGLISVICDLVQSRTVDRPPRFPVHVFTKLDELAPNLLASKSNHDFPSSTRRWARKRGYKFEIIDTIRCGVSMLLFLRSKLE